MRASEKSNRQSKDGIPLWEQSDGCVNIGHVSTTKVITSHDGSNPPPTSQELFGKRLRLQMVIDEWTTALKGTVVIKTIKWRSNNKVATFLAPASLSVKTFTISFKAEQTPDEVYLSPEQRNSFHNKRTELKKLRNNLRNEKVTNSASEEKEGSRQTRKRLDVRKLAKRFSNRLRWPLLATLLGSGEAGALPDDGIAKSGSLNLLVTNEDNDAAPQELRELLKQVPTSGDNISEEVDNTSSAQVPVSNENTSEGSNKPFKQLLVSDDRALQKLGKSSRQVPASDNRAPEEVSKLTEKPLEQEITLNNKISEELGEPLEQVPTSANQISEEVSELTEESLEQEITLDNTAPEESGQSLKTMLDDGQGLPEQISEPLEGSSSEGKASDEETDTPSGEASVSDDQDSEASGDLAESETSFEDQASEKLEGSHNSNNNDDVEPTSPVSPSTPDTSLPTNGEKDNPIIKDDLIDFGSNDGAMALEVLITRNAEFENYIGFYRVEDDQLRVRDPLTGTLLSPSDSGYREAALAASITDLLVTVDNGTSASFTAYVDAKLLGLFIAVDVEMQSLESASEIYFTDLQANSDGIEHVKLLGNSTFGFEDSEGGGDLDYNDMIVQINFPDIS